jgi:hypothetical protein
MTHQYVIASKGRIEPIEPGSSGATAIGWAAEAILAVGSDEAVRAISRGDSTFIDLGGCVVTPLPDDPVRAQALIAQTAASAEAGLDVGMLDVATLLLEAGLIDTVLEAGAPADLAFWAVGPRPTEAGHRFTRGLVAVVRGGAFTEGDEHYGPFPAL